MIDDSTIRFLFRVVIVTLAFVVVSQVLVADYAVVALPGNHDKATDAIHDAFEQAIAVFVGVVGILIVLMNTKKHPPPDTQEKTDG